MLWFGSPEMMRAWGELEYSVRTGKASWDHVFGTKPFDYLSANPERYELFHSAMADRASRWNSPPRSVATNTDLPSRANLAPP